MARVQVNNPNTVGTPVWLADFGSRSMLLPTPARLDASGFTAAAPVTVTTTASAAIGATSLTVSALSGAIPSGTILFFDAIDAYATTTANAAAAATSISVSALTRAVASGSVATYGATYSRKFVPAGTLVGRTYTERDAGTGFGPADAVTPDDEIYLTLHDVIDAAINPDVVLVRHNATVKENFLPGWAGLSTAVKTAIRARYRTITGTN